MAGAKTLSHLNFYYFLAEIWCTPASMVPGRAPSIYFLSQNFLREKSSKWKIMAKGKQGLDKKKKLKLRNSPNATFPNNLFWTKTTETTDMAVLMNDYVVYERNWGTVTTLVTRKLFSRFYAIKHQPESHFRPELCGGRDFGTRSLKIDFLKT